MIPKKIYHFWLHKVGGGGGGDSTSNILLEFSFIFLDKKTKYRNNNS